MDISQLLILIFANCAVFCSPAAAFDGEPAFFEFFHDQIPMIPLDFDYAVLNCATAAAFGLELFGQLLERFFFKGDSHGQGNPLALAPLGFPPYPDNTVAGRRRQLVTAPAFCEGFAAIFTHPGCFR